MTIERCGNCPFAKLSEHMANERMTCGDACVSSTYVSCDPAFDINGTSMLLTKI